MSSLNICANMLYACYIEIVLQCVFDLLNSLTKGLCRLCWEKNGQVKTTLIRQNRFTSVFNFISHSEYSDGCFLSVCKWHIHWIANIVLVIFSSCMFLWRTRSRSTTEIPGQQLDQYKTVSFLEYVSKPLSFFPLICYSPYPLYRIIFERKWNFSDCQSPYMYMYIILKVLLNAS